jgi:hypothetical protein
VLGEIIKDPGPQALAGIRRDRIGNSTGPTQGEVAVASRPPRASVVVIGPVGVGCTSTSMVRSRESPPR